MNEQSKQAVSPEGFAPAKQIPFDLKVTTDRMAILYSGNLPETIPVEHVDSILSKLRELDVAALPSNEQILELLHLARKENPRAAAIELMRGREPVPPIEGRIEWDRDFFNAGFLLNEETDNVDYHRYAVEKSVEEGDILARVIPPIDGHDGCDVFGKRIPPPSPQPVKVRVGKNVKLESETGEYYASASGRFNWKDNVLSVDIVYLVKGNVGPESGDVTHPGSVVVMGDVLGGYKIEASADIDVRGLVEPTCIKAGGNLSVQGGISGAKGQCIIAGGEVRAKFIIDADIEATGSVIAISEIIQSRISTRETVDVSRGRIVGGCVTALRGVRVAQIGSATHVSTSVLVGRDYSLNKRILQRLSEIKKIRRHLSARAPDTTSFFLEMEVELAKLRSRLEELLRESKRNDQSEIEVSRSAHSDSTLGIGRATCRLSEKKSGPFRARLGEKGVEFY